MSSLVLELQREAMDDAVPIGSLLRKALVVSRKLGASEIEEWLKLELEGYPNSDVEIPSYRSVSAQLRVRNPYHGLQPLMIEDPDLARRLSENRLGQSAGELHELIRGKDEGNLQVLVRPEQKAWLMNAMNLPLEPVFTISRTAIHGILEVVRTRVLDWALALEKQGVLGESMSFSAQEKAAAPAVSYVITNYIGEMHQSQLQQHSSGPQSITVSGNLSELVDFMMALQDRAKELGDEAAAELSAETTTVIAQAQSPKPKAAILGESLRSIRAILENATGSALASEVLPKLLQLARACGLGFAN